MHAIKAVYSGTVFKPIEPVPVDEDYEVVITFTTPIKKPERLQKHFSKSEKNIITKSLFGVLPPDIDLNKAREERLR
jgi:predicted DNA-binding antitoxin AbrB/MazE fold protein